MPILKQIAPNRSQLIGTGFFITRRGHFITAKHVLMDVIDDRGRQSHPVHIVHFVRGSATREEVLVRPVTRFSYSRTSELALGEVEQRVHTTTDEPVLNFNVALTTESPPIGSRILTFAYPESTREFDHETRSGEFVVSHYSGILEEHSDSPRDSTMITFPYYRSSVRILGGASGGPVFDQKSRVFAINCTGYDGADISYMARTQEARGLEIYDVRLTPEDTPRSYRVEELARRGHIVFEPPVGG